jgi:5-methylcytosine-specific restriction endonuclease McrA
MADGQGIISLGEAKARGLVRYFTGKPCCRGHISERNVARKGCIACARESGEEARKVDPTKARAATREWMANWRAANPEKVKERLRAFYWADPVRAREIARKHYHEKREKKVLAKRRERVANPDAYKQANLKYYLGNKAKHRAWGRNRKARKRGAPGSHTAADLAAILKAQNHRCAYCRSDLRKAKRHVDHIQPLARGGSNDRANLQYLCAPCNLAKGARDPVEFAQELGRLL